MNLILLIGISWYATAAPKELVELREAVRSMAKSKSCVNCHLPGQPGALQRILDVYNLRDTYWSASLGNDRLKRFEERMTDVLTDQQELGLVTSFVKKELAFRKSQPNERQRDLDQNVRERALNELGILRSIR